MDNLRFMRARYVQHAFKPHAHDYYVLGIIETGLQSFTYKHNKLITEPGNLIIINPGEVHTGEAAIDAGFNYRALYPSKSLMERFASEFNANAVRIPRFNGGIVRDRQMFYAMQKLHHFSENPTTSLELDERMTNFFITLIRRHADRNLNIKKYKDAQKAVLEARDFIEAYYSENITLSDLSELMHISPFHLARLFRRQIGISPHKYLENVRIRHAERLLSSGFLIADVAFMTGFSSQSHLTRTFKQFLGTTPGEFVKQRKIV